MLCPEHPKRDQNPKFTPLSETTSIPVCFIWESPPPGLSSHTHFCFVMFRQTADRVEEHFWKIVTNSKITRKPSSTSSKTGAIIWNEQWTKDGLFLITCFCHITTAREVVISVARDVSEIICYACAERSRIFVTFVVKFSACLPLLGFSNIQKMVYLLIFNGFLTLWRSPRIFGSLFSSWNFRKGKFWSL